jgi:hypothetical protein
MVAEWLMVMALNRSPLYMYVRIIPKRIYSSSKMPIQVNPMDWSIVTTSFDFKNKTLASNLFLNVHSTHQLYKLYALNVGVEGVQSFSVQTSDLRGGTTFNAWVLNYIYTY